MKTQAKLYLFGVMDLISQTNMVTQAHPMHPISPFLIRGGMVQV